MVRDRVRAAAKKKQDEAKAKGKSMDVMQLIGRINPAIRGLDTEQWKLNEKVRKAIAERDDAANASPWVEIYDAGEKAYYYWNRDSGETIWEKPEHYRMAAEDNIIKATIMIQCFMRGIQGRPKDLR